LLSRASEPVKNVELHAIQITVDRREREYLIDPLRKEPGPLKDYALRDLIAERRYVRAAV
jgi:hypothetical protein